MRLTLHSTKVLNLALSQDGLPQEAEDGGFWVPDLASNDHEESKYELTFSIAYMEGADDRYAVIFNFSSHLPSQALRLDVTYIAEFKVSEPVSPEFKDSHFARVNSPAIAFPYLRAFVSNFLLSSGYEPMILPSINFQALDAERRQKANGE